jgi:hypothetical protein
MVPKYWHSQSMGRNTVLLRTMARTCTGTPSRSAAVLFCRSKMIPRRSSVTSTVRRVVLYRALTPRLTPLARLGSMV